MEWAVLGLGLSVLDFERNLVRIDVLGFKATFSQSEEHFAYLQHPLGLSISLETTVIKHGGGDAREAHAYPFNLPLEEQRYR